MRNLAAGLITGAFAFAAVLPGTAAAQTPTYPEDFCDALGDIVTIVNSVPLLVGALGEENMALVNSLDCNSGADADINGGLDENDLPLPNGLLDGKYELGVIAAVLNDTGEPNNAQTRAAYETNYGLIWTAASDAGCAYCGLLPVLAPGLKEGLVRAIAGYLTLGDATTVESIGLLLSLLADIGATPPDPSAYVHLGALYGPDGDADGDSCTNAQEYDEFASISASVYVANALNPAEGCGGSEGEPEGSEEGEEEGETGGTDVVITGKALIQAGDRLDLRATGASGTFEWTKDGATLVGEDGSALVIDPVTEADSGVYRVIVNTGAKAILVSPPFAVNVVPFGALPVAGGLGLALAASACAMAGAAVLRRRK
jgi:hypothetical protein